MLNTLYQTIPATAHPFQDQKNNDLDVRNNKMDSSWNEYIPIKYNYLDMKSSGKYPINSPLPYQERRPTYRQETRYMPIQYYEPFITYQNQMLKNQVEYDLNSKRFDINRPKNYKMPVFVKQFKEYTPETDIQRKKALLENIDSTYQKLQHQNEQSQLSQQQIPSVFRRGQMVQQDIQNDHIQRQNFINAQELGYISQPQFVEIPIQQEGPLSTFQPDFAQEYLPPQHHSQHHLFEQNSFIHVNSPPYPPPQEYYQYPEAEYAHLPPPPPPPHHFEHPIHRIQKQKIGVNKEYQLDQYIQESSMIKQRLNQMRSDNKDRTEEILYKQSRLPEYYRGFQRPFYEIQGTATNKFYASPNMYRF